MSQDVSAGEGRRPAGTDYPQDTRTDAGERLHHDERLADGTMTGDEPVSRDADSQRDVTDRDVMDRDVADRDGTDRDVAGRDSMDRELTDGDVRRDGDRFGDVDAPPDDGAMAGEGRFDDGQGQLRDGEQLPGVLGEGPLDSTGPADQDHDAPLFDTTEAAGFRTRWTELQAGFVDDPRTAVQRADQLVAEVMQNLAATFARKQQELAGQWQADGDTEELRQALRRYRSYFDQLLRT